MASTQIPSSSNPDVEENKSNQSFTLDKNTDLQNTTTTVNINNSWSDLNLENTTETTTSYANLDPSQKPLLKQKRFTFSKVFTFILIIISIIALGFGFITLQGIYRTSNQVIVGQENGDCKNIFDLNCYSGINPFNKDQNIKLKGEDDGRINVLIIGTDSTAGLADTILLMSFYPKEKKIATLNFPRDLFVRASYKDDSSQTFTINEKINALYPFAERASSKEGNGALALSNFISSEFNIPIHYWMTTNFEAVEQVVDELGGVEVNVDKSFTDCQFPNRNYTGYLRPCPSFKTGSQQMNGVNALIYARSRMSPDDGGDFARSRRQMIVIQSILKKIREKGIFGNINNIQNYLNIVSKNVRTNVSIKEMLAFYKLFESFDINDSFVKSVWEEGNGFLCRGPESNGYNIVYCGGNTIGVNTSSNARKRANSYIQNLLFESQSKELFETNVAFLGNFSDDTNKIRADFENLGFTNILFNNNYSPIKRATATSKENITIYIPDDKLKNLFENLPNKPKTSYTLTKEMPLNRVVPTNFQSAKIIVWVASE